MAAFTRPLRLGDIAPDFTQETTVGSINFHEWIGNDWCILFSHPKAYTPVCTTELGCMASLQGEFAKRNTKIIAISCDPVQDNLGWSKDIKEVSGNDIGYPIICDSDRRVATAYNMLMEYGADLATVRSVFIIGPDKKIKLMIVYPPSTGRNFNEIVRVLDSLQLTANHKLATPVNWKPGEKCVVLPTVSDSDATQAFGTFEKVKPYLRYTDAPK